MKPQVKYGLLVGIAAFAIFAATTAAIAERVSILNYVWILVLAIGIYFSAKETKETTGYLTFGRGLGIGTLTSLIAGACDGILKYIYYKFIHHSSIVTIQQSVMDQLEKNPNIQSNPDQYNLSKKITLMLVSPGGMAFGNIIWTVFVGFMLSLIIAAVLKRDREDTNMPQF
jgi:hypothetical protein